MVNEEAPFNRATLRLWDGDEDITELFELEEIEEGYRPSGPYERVTAYTVQDPGSSLVLTSPPLDSHTRAMTQWAAEKGDPCPWTVPKNIRRTS